MKRSSIINLRKIHKYFGVIIGVQLLFWAAGGLFFSWSNLDQIHSDPYKSPPVHFDNSIKLVSPQKIIDQLNKETGDYEIAKLELVNVLGSPVYRFEITHPADGEMKYVLANAETGELKPPLSKDESVQLAVSSFLPDAPVKDIKHITKESIHRHHEYRGRILPAYAISFDHSSGVTIYVSPEMGEVVTFRNSNWRIFDFLWMMHTMDYSGRDNFGNYLLRVMAVLGLMTIISGFLLFFLSRKVLKSRKG